MKKSAAIELSRIWKSRGRPTGSIAADVFTIFCFVTSIILLSLLMHGVSQCCCLLRVLSIMKLLSADGLYYTDSELCSRLQRRAAAGRCSLRYKCWIVRQPSDCSHLHTSAAVATWGGLDECNKGKKILLISSQVPKNRDRIQNEGKD